MLVGVASVYLVVYECMVRSCFFKNKNLKKLIKCNLIKAC